MTARTGMLVSSGARRRKLRGRRSSPRRALRFTPYAWAKLLFLRDLGRTEVGGFGISASGDPLLVEDLRLVSQEATATTVRFDDASVADHFDECVDAGLPPERFARIWVHTHPGESPSPSGTDEQTFARVFGGCDWAVMAILARGGKSYARLRFNPGPGGEILLSVEIDYATSFSAADPAGWAQEYACCVHEASLTNLRQTRSFESTFPHTDNGFWDGLGEFDFEFDPFAFRDFTFNDADTSAWEYHDEHRLASGGENHAAG